MRQRVRFAVAGITVAAMTVGIAAPAGAQEGPESLGFEVDKTEGSPGDEVNGQVDVNDLRQNCWSRGDIVPIGDERWESGAITARELVTQFAIAILSHQLPVFVVESIIPGFDPDGSRGVLDAWVDVYGPVPDTNVGREIVQDARFSTPPEGIPDTPEGRDFLDFASQAFTVLTGSFGVGELSERLYPAVHVLTFADIETQEPVGERSNFDPDTGEGSVVVPEVEPGLWALAATCVFFPPWDDFPEAFDEGLVAAWNWSVENDNFPTGRNPGAWVPWAEAGGLEAMLTPMLEPQALGFQIFCVLDAEANCPAEEEELPPPGEDDVTPGEEPAPAEPVVAQPTFTG